MVVQQERGSSGDLFPFLLYKSKFVGLYILNLEVVVCSVIIDACFRVGPFISIGVGCIELLRSMLVETMGLVHGAKLRRANMGAA